MTALRKLTTLPAIAADARCIVYVRVSDEDQAKEDRVSLQEQERECRAFAAKQGLTVDYVWADPGVSGRDESRLERLTNWCEAHARTRTAPGAIIVLNASRWGRFVHNANASAFYKYRLSRAGWTVEAAQQPNTGNRTTDGVLSVVHDAQAAAESEEKAYRAHTGMLGQAELGRWLGRAPFGYIRVAVNGDRKRTLQPFEHAAKGERVELAPGDPEAVRTIKLIFRRACEGAACKAIAQELNAAKVPGPFDVYRRTTVPHARKWRGCTVRAILKNPVYGGTYIWNRRKAADTPKGKRPTRPESEWKRLDGAVPALVDRATVKTVQEEFKRRTKQRRRVRSTAYLLTGLATCGRCGAPLVGGGGHAPNRFYKCGASDDDKSERLCPGPRRMTVNQTLLERTVVERVAERVASWVKSGTLAKVLDRLIGQRPNERQARATLDKQRREFEAKRDRLEDAVLDGTLSKERGKVKLAEIEAGLARVDRELTELRLEPKRSDLLKERDRLLRLAANFPARLRVADPVAARDLLGQWLAGVVVQAPKHKGGDLPVEFLWRQVPAVGSQLAGANPARPGPARRCSRAGCPRRCRR